MNIDDLLQAAVAMGGSDLFLKAGSPPVVRLHGEMVPLETGPIEAEANDAMPCSLLTPEQIERLQSDRGLEFSGSISGVTRYRGNLQFQQGNISSAFHLIPEKIRSMDELRLPPVCKYFIERPHGVILVVGPPGSGKTTTLAAMTDHINQHLSVHLTMIEDPIEFVHEGKEAVVDQREVGQDTCSAPAALRSAMRQDNDVIVVGDLRNPEMISLAFTAAEQGHLVLATLSLSDTAQAVARIIDAFPHSRQNTVRAQLAFNLVGIVSQVLIKNKDGSGRNAAFETLVGVSSVRSLIRDGKIAQIHGVIQSGSRQGMITLDQSLAHLVRRGSITYEAALVHAQNVTEFHFLCTEGTDSPV